VASKFQNRLVGTIVLVALGVIILPGLLDGQKKHYQDEFAAIPLVPKPGIAMSRICCQRRPGAAFAAS
jgi:DedD protein